MKTYLKFLLIACCCYSASLSFAQTGTTWTSRTSAADNTWNSVTYSNGVLVAVALGGTGTSNRIMTSGFLTPPMITSFSPLSAQPGDLVTNNETNR